MKRDYLSCLLVLFFFCSCTNGAFLDFDSDKDSNPAIVTKSDMEKSVSFTSQSYSISVSDARFAAEKIFSAKQKLVDFYPYVFGGDTLFYIANYNQGYKVLSADKRTSVILLEADKGIVSPEKNDGSFNAPLFWLDNLAADIYEMKHSNREVKDAGNLEFWNSVSKCNSTSKRVPSRIDSIGFEDDEHTWVKIQEYETQRTYLENDIDHLIQTKWGQWEPWNEKMPFAAHGDHTKCPTGCAAVAMSQILYFTHHNLGKPTWLNHDAEMSGVSYDINNCTLSYYSGTYTPDSPRWNQMALNSFGIHTDYVSSLMVDVGYTLGIQYTPEESGASSIDIDDFNHYGITCNKAAFNTGTVDSNIQAGKPVLITAFAGANTILGINVSYYDGHAWLIDGMQTKVNERTIGYVWKRVCDLDYEPNGLPLYTEEQAMALEPNLFPGKTVTETSRAYSYFYRMNWGWDGSYDNVLYGKTDNGWEVGSYNFRYNKQIIFNIQ